MGQKTIQPAKLKGSVKVPPSKSMAHRAILCAALANGQSTVSNIDFSDDILATMDAMQALGAKIEKKGNSLEICGIGPKSERQKNRRIDCKESGKRPLNVYTEIFDEQGMAYKAEGPLLDFTVSGRLKPGKFKLRGDVSSQFITGLLYALPLLEADSEIEITTHLESKNYIDLTLSALKDFGIHVENRAYKTFLVPGNQTYKAGNYRVEGDFSQAAFFLCADALGSNVEVQDLAQDSLQGDRAVLEILQRMGAEVSRRETGLCCRADALSATEIDASQCPDIIPVVAVVAALCKGTTRIYNAGRLRIKECDRLHAICSELTKLGAQMTEQQDSILICGVENFTGGTVWSHKDHRIAMMLAIAATRAQKTVTIEDWECVSKSYPHFFEDYAMLGGNCQ